MSGSKNDHGQQIDDSGLVLHDAMVVVCPECGCEFPLSEALTANIETRIRRDAEQVASTREKALAERHKTELAAAARKAAEDAKAAVSLELTDLRTQVEEQSGKLEESQEKELALRKKARKLDDLTKNAELEIERRLEGEREAIEKTTVDRLDEEHRLADLKKDHRLKELQDQIEVLKRKATQGSQQEQGEIAELDLEFTLGAQFPDDAISAVPKGVRGVDVVQNVLDRGGQACGAIAWEVKNTKNWSDSWLAKLRDDQRELKADVAILVTSVLPKDVAGFARVDGIWVCDSASALGLASALRYFLVQIARSRVVAEGRDTKTELLYNYLTGTEFRQRVEAVVEAFVSMQEDLARERRGMEKIWAKREKELARAFNGMAGMYGDMQGIVGAVLPNVSQLEIEPPGLDDDSDITPI
jgi:hypothetical protein